MKNLLMIVSAADKDRANELALQWDANGVNTFDIGYSGTGEPPATHYIACANMSDETAAAILQAAPVVLPFATVISFQADQEQPGYAQQQIAARNLKPIVVDDGLE